MSRIESEDHRGLWETKRVLRAVYEDYYEQIASFCGEGPTLEIGTGVGNLRQTLPDMVSIDIQASSWVDAAADAQALPFADGAFGNVIAIDTLHHVAVPLSMLRECSRVLRPGGMLVLLEPAITAASRLFYRYLHPERVDMAVDPLGEEPLSNPADPDDANQAIATLLAGEHADHLRRACPQLQLRETRWLSLLVYPLSGGFRPWSLLPAFAAVPLLRIERRLCPLLGRWLGFRLLMAMQKGEMGTDPVLEKTGSVP